MKYAKFYRYLIPFWKIEACVLLLSWLAMLLGLAGPYVAKLIVDKASVNKDMGLFIKLLILGTAIFILSSIVGVLNSYLSRYISIRLNFSMKSDFFKKLQRLPYRFFQDTPGGENLYKLGYDVDRASQFMVSFLSQAFSLLPKLVFIFVIIYIINWRVSLLSLLLAPLSYITPFYFNKLLERLYKISVENSQTIFKSALEILSHMRLVKISGMERGEVKKYAVGLIKNTRFDLTSAKLQTTSSFTNSLINRVVLSAIVFYGGYEVTKGMVTLGGLIAIAIYLNQLVGLQASISQFFYRLSQFKISCERLSAILGDRPESMENANARNMVFPKGAVEFKNVTFGYAPDKPVLAGLNFGIQGGARISLVGPSGCGKTTTVSLIARLYSLNGGQILIDGRDVRDIKSLSFYAQIGVAMQNPSLWNDTIENNIKYWKKDAGFDEIAAAAETACIDEYIKGLPKKYDTIIGEAGCKISEGQKQRIAIARALIKRPKILILDEAMSAIDSETEDRIIGNIKEGFKNSTIIVISHRLATVEKTDCVYFLTGPSFMEIGTHEKLIKHSSRYNELFASQLIA